MAKYGSYDRLGCGLLFLISTGAVMIESVVLPGLRYSKNRYGAGAALRET